MSVFFEGRTIDLRKKEVVEESPSPFVIVDVKCKRLTRDQQHQGRRQCEPTASQKCIPSFSVSFSIPDDFKLLGNAYDLFLGLCPPKHPKFKNIATRLGSYRNASGIYQKSRGPLSEAGLFFSGDIVTCFHCGGAHGEWREGNDPHVEHSRWYPECLFTLFTLGNNRVYFICGEHRNHLSRLAERGRTETSVKALVDARFGSEDISFYEASGIKVQVLYLAASSLREDASKGDIEAKLSELIDFRLEIDWKTIARDKQCSDRKLDMSTVCAPHVLDMLQPEGRNERIHFEPRDPQWHPPVTFLEQRRPSRQRSQPSESADLTGCFEYLNRSRYPEYADPSKRLATFDHFPHTPTELLNPGSMANAGLFYVGDVTTDYVPVVPSDRTADVTGPQNSGTVQRQEVNGATYQTERQIIPQNEPVQRMYAKLADRVAYFQSYQETAKGNTQKMAKAGFFYTGIEDRTTCFQCGNSLCRWDVNDDPQVEHAKWFPGCRLHNEDIIDALPWRIGEEQEAEMSQPDGFIATMMPDLMSSDVVRRLLSQGIPERLIEMAIETRLNNTGLIDVLDEQDVRRAILEVSPHVPQVDSRGLSMCVMCGREDRRTVFFPCRHFVACRGCASHCTACPSCTRPITTKGDAFLTPR
ncbi:uncharacterized protein LOC135391795 isoform X2 [Ornithodoros turicata]|uniref:uncharacterized protein LOC135391795 isoform X2 n=1 Tax=Ornithodoros turicata TaxID=34597 RepID=UPI0031399AE1